MVLSRLDSLECSSPFGRKVKSFRTCEISRVCLLRQRAVLKTAARR